MTGKSVFTRIEDDMEKGSLKILTWAILLFCGAQILFHYQHYLYGLQRFIELWLSIARALGSF